MACSAAGRHLPKLAASASSCMDIEDMRHYWQHTCDNAQGHSAPYDAGTQPHWFGSSFVSTDVRLIKGDLVLELGAGRSPICKKVRL